MKNQHLLPINIVDLVEKLNNPNVRDPERTNILQRIETILDYCGNAVTKFNKNNLKHTIRK